jgi:hypothetical protein
MLDSPALELRRELENLVALVRWQDGLRGTVHSFSSGAAPLALDAGALAIMRTKAPDKLTWQIFDHCAAVTRIYALFERAVAELVEEYLSFLSKAFPAYEDLPDDVRNQFRVGVGFILSKWGPKSLYSNVREDTIAAGLADGLRKKSYSLLADAFLIDTDNYRTDTLIRLFKKIGFDDAFSWLCQSDSIVEFRKAHLGTDTPESFLDEFVRTRNEAAHGSSTNIASLGQLEKYAQFLVLVTESFTALLRSRLIRVGIRAGHSVHLGNVIADWSANVIGVRAITSATISVGDNLYAGKKQIDPVTVVSLRVANTEHATLSLTPDFEFGVKLDRRIRTGADLYRWI